MRRLFYLAIGVGIGVAVVRQVTRAAGRLTPSSVADKAAASASGLVHAVREFADDVRAAMAQREIELRDALTGDGEHRGGGRS